MATPASPEPAAEPVPPPSAPAPVPTLPSGPVCGACGDPAVVNWRRRLAAHELAAHVQAEEDRRAQRRLLADPQLPPPAFPPLPTGDDDTRTVYACAGHAIRMDTAAHIHASTCTAPNNTGIDGCDCTPEPHPEPASTPAEETPSRLPAHWLPEGA